MLTWVMETGFWLCLALLVYAYLGFPLLTFLRAFGKRRPASAAGGTPSISVCIAAYNEESLIAAKLKNLLECDYPRHRLQIIVASDGSSDRTVVIADGFRSEGVFVLELPRGGKNIALNAAVAVATGEVLVFTDADVRLEKDALRRLVAPFEDTEVGCVAGDFHYALHGEVNEGEQAYWNFDRKMKEWQMRAGGITSATGQLYALRRKYFRPLIRGVTDDFYTSVQAQVHGKRIVFAADARAYGPGAENTRKEFKRKVRVTTAGLKGVWEVRGLLNPFRHGYYAWQLFSHKVLRRLAALPFLGQTVALPFLASKPFYGWILGVQGAFHLVALAGFLLGRTRLVRFKPLMLPCYFDMVLAAVIVALAKLGLEHQEDLWSPQRVPAGSQSLPSADNPPKPTVQYETIDK